MEWWLRCPVRGSIRTWWFAGLAARGAAFAVVGEDAGEAGGKFLGGGWVGPSAFWGAGELLCWARGLGLSGWFVGGHNGCRCVVGSDFSAGCGGEAHSAVDENSEEQGRDERASDGATVVEQERSIEYSCDYSGDEAGSVGGKGQGSSDLRRGPGFAFDGFACGYVSCCFV